MAKTQWLQFYVVLNNAERVAELQAQYPFGRPMAPTDAVAEYSAPWNGANPSFTPPATWSPWATSDKNYPINVRTFTRKSGGWFGISWLFGSSTKYIWYATFVYEAPQTPTINGAPVTEDVAIAQRRFIDGFEIPDLGEGGANGGSLASREASRHLGGLGFAFRGSTVSRRHNLDEFTPGSTFPNGSWVRFYIRPRKFPDASTSIWRSHGNPSDSAGISIDITPDAKLAIYDTSAGSVRNLVATAGALVVDTWYRVDILFKYNTLGFPATDAFAQLYLNGVLIADLTAFANFGLGASFQRHIASSIGNGFGTANTLEVDIDDWVEADLPLKDSSNRYAGKDWLNGSSVRLVRPTGFAATHSVNWAGDWRSLLHIPSADGSAGVVTSSTADALLAVTTDAGRTIDVEGGLGCVALAVALRSFRGATAGNGTLGYSLNGAGAVMSAIAQSSTPTLAWNRVMYRPTGMLSSAIVDVTPLELHHAHNANAEASQVRTLAAAAEIVGSFGREDIRATETGNDPIPASPPALGIHNAPYPTTPWARDGAPPQSPVYVKGGTYVGNGTGQDLTFPFPIHWLWVRRVDGTVPGFKWFSTMIAPHVGLQEGTMSELMVRAEVDPDFAGAAAVDQQEQQYKVRLSGTNVNSNAAGITYQYIAVSDPGQRFLLNGAFAHNNALASAVNNLVNSGFTPECAFFQAEQIAVVSTSRYAYKGPGHAAATFQVLDVAETANGVTFGAGTLTSQPALCTLGALQIAFSCWRRDDGSSDAGRTRVVQLASYIGDGTASRTIGFAPASSRRPLFALVVPHTGAAIYRDPSHTGLTSSAIAGTINASTGITGGAVDSISVGSALNANGVTYDVFVIPGSATAGNGGWSQNTEEYPVEPDSPAGGGWDTPPTDPDLVPVVVVTTNPDPGDLTTDIASTCLASSTRLVNQALEVIGVTKRISSLAADTSLEADSARLHFKTVIDALLRSAPWDFARERATLTLVGGTSTSAVNYDWQYSYRVPSDCVKVRRIMVEGIGKSYDPDPPPFELGQDATGELLFTNLDSVRIEYTKRVDCPAALKDPLFRLAAKFALGEALAPGLAKDEKRVVWCTRMHGMLLDQARTKDAQEQQHHLGEDEPDWITGR